MSTPAADGAWLGLHSTVERSRANGPGERFVVWVQGCPLACPGCFNPDTHADEPRERVRVEALTERVAHLADGLDGMTVSGGEPLAQAPAVAALLAGVRARTRLSVVVFTGYAMREIERDPMRSAVLEHVDVLVAGRYVAGRRRASGLLGSANQTVHLLTSRYGPADIDQVPECEVHVLADGGVIVSGVDVRAPLPG